MAIGIVRKILTEYSTVGGGTYTFGDVRIRQVLIGKIIDELVATGLWSIVNEEVPTSDFTSTSTYYNVWVKFKNSDHLFRFSTNGGSASAMPNINVYLCKAGSTTAHLVYNPFTCHAANSSEPSYPFARLGISMIYGPSWCYFTLSSYHILLADLPTPDNASAYWMGGVTLFDLFDPGLTSEHVSLLNATGNTAYVMQLSFGYLTGNDAKFGRSSTSIVQSDSFTNYILPMEVEGSSNWRVKDFFAFTNSSGHSLNSILTIDGYYYWLAFAGVILKLGPIPV